MESKKPTHIKIYFIRGQSTTVSYEDFLLINKQAKEFGTKYIFVLKRETEVVGFINMEQILYTEEVYV